MGFFRYVREAFNARPWGMWVPPNWVGLGAFVLLGLEEPGLWIVGAGLELGYLAWLTTSARFRRWVDSKDALHQRAGAQKQTEALLARLDPVDQNRFRQLQLRCEAMLQQQPDLAATDIQTQAEGLGKLIYVYLRLLVTRRGIQRVIEGSSAQSIDKRVSEVKGQLDAAASPGLRKSLGDQLDILSERKARHAEGREKLQFIDAELSRIEEQVELIREGMIMATDPGTLSRKIDAVGNTLGGTTKWIRQQQELFGDTEDLLGDPPAVALKVPQAAAQK